MFYSVHFFQFLYAIDVLTNWALTFASAAFLTIPTVLYFKLNLAFGAIYVLNKFSYLISLKTKSNCQTKMHSLLAQIRLKPFQSPCLLNYWFFFEDYRHRSSDNSTKLSPECNFIGFCNCSITSLLYICGWIIQWNVYGKCIYWIESKLSGL